MLHSLCIFLITGQTLDVSVLNQSVDKALNEINTVVNLSGTNIIHIPAVKYKWKYHKRTFKFSGSIYCRDGYVKSLGSLKRTGDVMMNSSDNHVSVKLSLGLGKLEAGFKVCKFKARHLFSIKQHFTASVASNSIQAEASLIKNGTLCTARLDHIKLAKLGKIKVRTGGGIFHKIEDKIISRFVHKSVGRCVNSKLKKYVSANFTSEEQDEGTL